MSGETANKMELSPVSMRPCQCGCGTPLPFDKPERRFIHGHNHRGLKHDKQWTENQAKGAQESWKDADKYRTLRHPSAELVERRVAKLRGRKRPAEVMLKVSKALPGRPLSPEHRIKCSKNWFKGPQSLSPEAESRRRKSISESRKGCHGYGRAARDRLDHAKALHWVIKDPQGVPHEFDNRQSWARGNEYRFLPDDRPDSKLPLWERFVAGMERMHWKGWTLVTVREQAQNDPGPGKSVPSGIPIPSIDASGAGKSEGDGFVQPPAKEALTYNNPGTGGNDTQ